MEPWQLWVWGGVGVQGVGGVCKKGECAGVCVKEGEKRGGCARRDDGGLVCKEGVDVHGGACVWGCVTEGCAREKVCAREGL